MRTYTKLAKTAGLLAAVAILGTSFAAQAADQMAKALRVKGTVKYHTGNAVWVVLKPGTELGTGAVVETGADSEADLLLNAAVYQGPVPTTLDSPSAAYPISTPPATAAASKVDQSVIRLMAGTTLALNKVGLAYTGIETVSETDVTLSKGKVLGTVPKLGGASYYHIHFNNGMAAVRGTILTVGSDGTTSCARGVVEVTMNGTPSTTSVAAGQTFSPSSGQPPTQMSVEQLGELNQMAASAQGQLPGSQPPVTDATKQFTSPVIGR